MLEFALFCQALVWVLVWGVFLATRQATIYHPLTVYLGFHGLVFVMRPFLVHYLDFDSIWHYMRIQPSNEIFIFTLLVSSVAMLVFAATSIAAGWTAPKFTLATPVPFTIAQRRGLLLTTLLLGPLVAYSIKSLNSGGLEGHHVGGTFVLTGASGYTLEAQFMIGPILCGWLVVTRFKWTSMLPLVVYIAYRSYTGWNRWTIVLLFLSLALVYAWQTRMRWVPVWAVAVAIPLFFLFHLLGQNRDYFRQMLAGEAPRQEIESSLSETEKLKLKYDVQEFANFDFLCFVLAAVPDKTGTYTYGSQYLQLFTEPIPRKLWPGKPAGAPIAFFSLNNYGNFLGLTPTLPGDGWMSGGWLGLVITMGLVGGLLGWAHRWFWAHSHVNMASLFYLIGLAMLPQWFRDGGISISKFLFWNLIPLFLWLGLTWLSGERLVRCQEIIVPGGTRLRLINARRTPGAGSV